MSWIKFIKSPTGKFRLAYNVGDCVDTNELAVAEEFIKAMRKAEVFVPAEKDEIAAQKAKNKALTEKREEQAKRFAKKSDGGAGQEVLEAINAANAESAKLLEEIKAEREAFAKEKEAAKAK